ncbi:hypothetical protein GUITHDRAFT_118067 [Guillardia theta CCMP2712]|uniref:Uncharacterized protein n=1 Tax=Guillardia theta (strain CCMP2712) TaxID=905079 RepID=L1II91_GUITC|nr:hypothetical protein GUITHDRAFT_118067 [Guillardia theta CCMP2712]EKX35792.1 hypothetical protein GUITHDRAFT_118067 [Guillardia theta CCMP2712]|eukprot:XP_005822772.1 hypothetical protein GUITHDRAFT_118067 [Guillardia theta CCMP2712]
MFARARTKYPCASARLENIVARAKCKLTELDISTGFQEWVDGSTDQDYFECASELRREDLTSTTLIRVLSENTELTSLKLSDCGLQDQGIEETLVMLSDLPNLTLLDLGHLDISSIAPFQDAFYICTRLEHLDLGGNLFNENVEDLSVLTNLERLKHLNLSMNRLRKLPRSYDQLTNLTTLILGGNCLNEFPAVIRSFANLQFLDLGYNAIPNVPGWITRFTNLEVLALGNDGDPEGARTAIPVTLAFNLLSDVDLSGLRMSDDGFPTWLLDLDLKCLDLSCNNFTRLPAEVKQWTRLEVLELQAQGGGVFDLPPEMSLLSSLTRLNLGSNTLQDRCLEKFDNFVNMRTFSLHECWLTWLPKCVQSMSSLTKLELGRNNIGVFPDMLTSLGCLTYLNMTSNRLQSLPDFVLDMTSLCQLHVHSNDLKKIPAYLLQHPRLQTFSVGRNESLFSNTGDMHELCNNTILSLDFYKTSLSGFPMWTLSCRNLAHLSIHSNSVTTLPDSLGCLSTLMVLSASLCSLSGPIPSCILQLRKLRWLGLYQNKLDSLHDDIATLTSLRHLDVEGNRIVQVGSLLEMTWLYSLSIAGNPMVRNIPSELLGMARDDKNVKPLLGALRERLEGQGGQGACQQ